jgi:predicted branched-subunit amino acid permease
MDIARHSSNPHWSLSGLWQGARLSLPILPGTSIFAVAFGTIAAQKGLTFFEATLMSALVYAGAAQLVVLEIWPASLTLSAVIALAAVAATVNLRFVLMSASLRPWLGPLPAWQSYPALFLTTDATWLIGLRYHAGGGSDVGIFVGNGLAIWLGWVATTMVGYQLGALITDPGRFGLDLIMPIFFTAMLVPLWRGARRGAAWAIAGAVALVFAWLVPGWWFIVVGALTGSIAGGFLDDGR